MKLRVFIIGALIAAALQTAALGKIIYDRAQFLQTGTEVVLQTGFVDPRDLFRGHYVTLNLVISRINLETSNVSIRDDFTHQDTLYVELDTSSKPFATAKTISKEYPIGAIGPVIKGTASSTYSEAKSKNRDIRISFPFDRYFAPKLRAKELENLRRDRKLGVILMLDDKGIGAIAGITIDGKKVYEEPLF